MKRERQVRDRTRRIIKAFLIFDCVLFLAVVIVGWNICWRSPPFYTTAPAVSLPVPIMTTAQYNDVIATHPRPYIVEIERADGGALVLFGSEHTLDRAHPQMPLIEQAWDDLQPSVALVEGRLGFWVGGFGDSVTAYGEFGLTNELARRDDVEVYSWEPTREAEVEIVLRDFAAKRVALFYVLRPVFSGQRHGIDNADAYVAPFLEERTTWPGLENTLGAIDDIDAMWKADFPDEPDWRVTSDEFGLPGYLADIAGASSAARDQHFAQIILDLVVNKKERVFAIAGSSHAVKLDAALRALLENDEK